MGWRTNIAETSAAQQKALAIIPKIVSMLSFLCSLYIVVDVWRIPRARRKVYHRILLGMSASDCTSSLAWFFTTWPIPPDVLPVWGAKGTQTYCELQGFFTQTSIATVLYSGCLSVYYYLVIGCGWSQSRLNNSKVEWLMHIVPLSYAIGTSSVSVALGLMNPIGWDCWIASVPLGCQESWLNSGKTTCIRGNNANLFQWAFFYIPLWITIICVTSIMASIVWKFWIQEQNNEVWRRKSMGIPDEVPRNDRSHTFRRRNSNGLNNNMKSRQARRSRLEEVVWQSLFYVGGFYFSWIFPTILRITEVTGDIVYYHWVQLSATFLTTQGIINLFVYLRPQYRRIKAQRRRQEQQTLQQQHRLNSVIAQASLDGSTKYTTTITTDRGGSVAVTTFLEPTISSFVDNHTDRATTKVAMKANIGMLENGNIALAKNDEDGAIQFNDSDKNDVVIDELCDGKPEPNNDETVVALVHEHDKPGMDVIIEDDAEHSIKSIGSKPGRRVSFADDGQIAHELKNITDISSPTVENNPSAFSSIEPNTVGHLHQPMRLMLRGEQGHSQVDNYSSGHTLSSRESAGFDGGTSSRRPLYRFFSRRNTKSASSSSLKALCNTNDQTISNAVIHAGPAASATGGRKPRPSLFRQFSRMTEWAELAVKDIGKVLFLGEGGDNDSWIASSASGGSLGRLSMRGGRGGSEDMGGETSQHMVTTNARRNNQISMATAASMVAAEVAAEGGYDYQDRLEEDVKEEEQEIIERVEDDSVASFNEDLSHSLQEIQKHETSPA